MNKKNHSKEMLELLSHPGETLKEEIIERNMSQAELARRCGVSEKHISSVISGEKDISVSFAKKLEYVLGLDSRFWLNLQMNYNIEYYELIERVEINDIELTVLSKPNFKRILEWLIKHNYISAAETEKDLVLSLREFLNVGNLSNVENFNFEGAFRTHSAEVIDKLTLLAWICVCEVSASEIQKVRELDLNTLVDLIPKIRMLMFREEPNSMMKELQDILASVGIRFVILQHFDGAPIHGYIKTSEEDIVLGTTIKGGYSDIFWFTLFHEITHIIRGDYRDGFVDFKNKDTKKENIADEFARNVLINKDYYKEFVEKGVFTRESIKKFSKKCIVIEGITIGRLQKDGYIESGKYDDMRQGIEWVDLGSVT